MCRGPKIGLFVIQEREFEIPICRHVGPCCDMEIRDWRDIMAVLVQPIQTAVKAKLLEVNVRDLTARVETMNKTLAKVKTVKTG
jgi:hypothetical protein